MKLPQFPELYAHDNPERGRVWLATADGEVIAQINVVALGAPAALELAGAIAEMTRQDEGAACLKPINIATVRALPDPTRGYTHGPGPDRRLAELREALMALNAPLSPPTSQGGDTPPRATDGSQANPGPLPAT